MASSFDYAGAATFADELLKYFGTTATFTRRVEGAYDTATSSAAITQSTFSATAVFLETRDKRETDAVQKAERRILVSPKSAHVPLVGDHVKMGSYKFQIMNVMKVSPSGVAVLYDCEVRA